MNSIKLIVFDFDGTLTDNRVLVFQDGTEAVYCNRSDGLGFDMFRHLKISTLIMSTEKNPVVKARAKKLQVPVLSGVQNKAVALKEYCDQTSCDVSEVVFVGNDLNDLSAMKLAGISIGVADSHKNVLSYVDHVLEKKGGEGITLDVINILGLNSETIR